MAYITLCFTKLQPLHVTQAIRYIVKLIILKGASEVLTFDFESRKGVPNTLLGYSEVSRDFIIHVQGARRVSVTDLEPSEVRAAFDSQLCPASSR